MYGFIIMVFAVRMIHADSREALHVILSVLSLGSHDWLEKLCIEEHDHLESTALSRYFWELVLST